LLASLSDLDYPGIPERAILFTIEAWDVNCPKHIHKRVLVSEVAPVIDRLENEVAELKARLKAVESGSDAVVTDWIAPPTLKHFSTFGSPATTLNCPSSKTACTVFDTVLFRRHCGVRPCALLIRQSVSVWADNSTGRCIRDVLISQLQS
jgi:hypothetical protein